MAHNRLVQQFKLTRTNIPLIYLLVAISLLILTGFVKQDFQHLGWFNTKSNQITQVVFIDAAISNPEVLTSQVGSDTDIIILDKHSNSIAAITQTLAQYTNLNAVHIVSHGDVASLQLNDAILDGGNLNLYQNQLKEWKKSLKSNADILLYGCNMAKGEQGTAFVQAFSQLVQADIAASTDLTGTEQVGNWELEFSTGKIEASIAFLPTTVKAYSGVLKQLQVTTVQDGGTGSLRVAIAQSNVTPEDDLIDLSRTSGTISLQSSLPAITGNVFIKGNGDNIISGENAHRVLTVERGNVDIKNLTIANGLAQGNDGVNGAGAAAGMGGGLYINDGVVTLSNVSFMNNRAVGGTGTSHTSKSQIASEKNKFQVNRGAIIGINGINFSDATLLNLKSVKIDTNKNKFKVNRGAIANVNGIGIGGIGSIAFGGGGGFGGFGNAGNGGNGGNAGATSGNGGNGGDGGDGGTGIFGSFGMWEAQGGFGTVAFGGVVDLAALATQEMVVMVVMRLRLLMVAMAVMVVMAVSVVAAVVVALVGKVERDLLEKSALLTEVGLVAATVS